MSIHSVYSQVDAIKIIDAVAGTLLPKITDGIKEIKDAKNKDKDALATKLEENYKKESEAAIKKAKEDVLSQVKKDIEYLKDYNRLEVVVNKISNDVGAISIYKDANFINTLLEKEAVTVKNQVVLKFQNLLSQIKNNETQLNQLNSINSTNIPSGGEVAEVINSITTDINTINVRIGNCPKLTEDNNKETDVNSCLKVISGLSNEISNLQINVRNLGVKSVTMLNIYLKKLEDIK